jgi:DNA-binding XRE family transcriptional regulator
MPTSSRIGRTTAEASRRRARQSPEYRAEFARLQPYEEIARQIISLRMAHGLSQEALALQVGMTKSAISRLESGRHAPTMATLQKIAGAFDHHLWISFDSPEANSRGGKSPAGNSPEDAPRKVGAAAGR